MAGRTQSKGAATRTQDTATMSRRPLIILILYSYHTGIGYEERITTPRL